MPECERCGETHATVNEATWVNQSTRLCPSCWTAAVGHDSHDSNLEAALDGLMTAAKYADDRGLEDLVQRLNTCYQDLGKRAPNEDWFEGGTGTAAEVLAEKTGRPKEDFEPPEDADYPNFDELELEEVDDA